MAASAVLMALVLAGQARAGYETGFEPVWEKEAPAEAKVPAFTEPTTGMEFVLVPGGCFQMGSSSSEKDRSDDEGPVHEVCVDGFYMGKYEVTQGQWRKIMGSNPAHFSNLNFLRNCGDNCPVEQVSWDDVQGFVVQLNRLTGKYFRLPTEAEWEYAARSGGRSEKGAGIAEEGRLGDYAWYGSNSGSQTHAVGTKAPNGLGLYDMSGNVWEWCQDWYDGKYYGSSPRWNPPGPLSGSDHVIRGGAWDCERGYVRAASRGEGGPGNRHVILGFRLALPLGS